MLDKRSGFLKLDRPQRYSSLSPEPYGFIPRTLCGPTVAAFAGKEAGRTGLYDVTVVRRIAGADGTARDEVIAELRGHTRDVEGSWV